MVTSELVDRFSTKSSLHVAVPPTSKTGVYLTLYPVAEYPATAPPGVLTEFGYTLREPCGHIQRARTESSAIICGCVDGDWFTPASGSQPKCWHTMPRLSAKALEKSVVSCTFAGYEVFLTGGR
ncbi:hypothetical protein DIJ64_05140 [Mycobacterium leprae]|uniref:Uncharacterized protein n=1 Tax=Mycobacterium leprae TaxID=1769 RepID=A0AAD0KQE5_MYCLR|nr:hypothetical protein DIJ64_05140 [Mycobacterium leprae]OAR20715.1 hypothetical protein A8144_09505 [Mycobacterium leprae 3125609]OAX70892.1 hypothetical protein A3216_09270 [Mycobacterium leprae 7935681]